MAVWEIGCGECPKKDQRIADLEKELRITAKQCVDAQAVEGCMEKKLKKAEAELQQLKERVAGDEAMFRVMSRMHQDSVGTRSYTMDEMSVDCKEAAEHYKAWRSKEGSSSE